MIRETPATFWQNSAFVTADPSNPANHMAAFVGSSSQGPINASGAGVVVPVSLDNPVTLSLQMYYPSVRNAGGSPVIAFQFMNQSMSFGTSHFYNAQWAGDDGNVLAFDFNGTDAVVSKDAWHTLNLTVDPTTGAGRLLGGWNARDQRHVRPGRLGSEPAEAQLLR